MSNTNCAARAARRPPFKKLLDSLSDSFDACMAQIGALPEGERMEEYRLVASALAEHAAPLVENLSPEQLEYLIGLCEKNSFADARTKEKWEAIRGAIGEGAVKEYKHRRDPKPRLAERDAAIVRYRDVDQLSYGQIARKLNDEVCKRNVHESGSGKSITKEAFRKAYYRGKEKEGGADK